MRLDYKLAILKSGRYQFEIAHAAGLKVELEREYFSVQA
jgi:hypothetical protein